jgi:hypothetical protein
MVMKKSGPGGHHPLLAKETVLGPDSLKDGATVECPVPLFYRMVLMRANEMRMARCAGASIRSHSTFNPSAVTILPHCAISVLKRVSASP